VPVIFISEPLVALVSTLTAFTEILISAPLVAEIEILLVLITSSPYTSLPLVAFKDSKFVMVTYTFRAFALQIFFSEYIFKTPLSTSVIIISCKFSSASTVILFLEPWLIYKSMPVLTLIPVKFSDAFLCFVTTFLLPFTLLNISTPQEENRVSTNKIVLIFEIEFFMSLGFGLDFNTLQKSIIRRIKSKFGYSTVVF
jgi:hypothetical protein